MLTSLPISSPVLPTFRPGPQRVAALMDVPGVGFFALADSLTGYGRTTGYDSLANARRAAYMLSVGAESPAAGIFNMGNRFFVRALGTSAAPNPHGPGGSGIPKLAKPLSLLHFEGADKAHFGWVADPRLVMVVDGKTKIWSRDAHHPAPVA